MSPGPVKAGNLLNLNKLFFKALCQKERIGKNLRVLLGSQVECASDDTNEAVRGTYSLHVRIILVAIDVCLLQYCAAICAIRA